MRWLDHEVVRIYWTNLYQIAPGVWRSNHPTEQRFRDMPGMGITTVLNLRGALPRPYYWREVALCQELGLRLIDLPMSGSSAPERATLVALIETFRSLTTPFVMHCKSGADRTGLASAIYLLVILGRPLAEARAMLSAKYIHFDTKRVGILDELLRCYDEAHARSAIGFEDWVREVYDPAEVTARHLERYRK